MTSFISNQTLAYKIIVTGFWSCTPGSCFIFSLTQQAQKYKIMNVNINVRTATSPEVRYPGQVRAIRRMNIDTLSISVSGCNDYLSDQAVLLLQAVDAEQPPSVQLTLIPGVLPGECDIREQVLVPFLAL